MSSSKATLFSLSELDNLLDLALCLGFEVEPGHDQQQIVENTRSMDQAYDRAIWVFDDMDQVDAVLSPELKNDEVAAYMKRGVYVQPPAIKNWKAEIGIQPLSEYLEQQ